MPTGEQILADGGLVQSIRRVPAQAQVHACIRGNWLMTGTRVAAQFPPAGFRSTFCSSQELRV